MSVVRHAAKQRRTTVFRRDIVVVVSLKKIQSNSKIALYLFYSPPLFNLSLLA